MDEPQSQAALAVHFEPVANLLLDPANPRLRPMDQPSQDELLQELWLRHDLDPLVTSLAANGYFTEEPLIATPEGAPEGKYFVVEGNRRLASLKLLLEADSRASVGYREPPAVAEAARQTLDPVPIKVYGARADVFPYLGVRHIAGVRPWESLAKARYVRTLVETGHTVSEISRMVGAGNRTDLIRRWLLSLSALDQANDATQAAWADTEEDLKFSLLYTAMGYQAIRARLGIDDIPAIPGPRPVAEDRIPDLVGLMTDLYGSPDGAEQPKVVDSRSIRALADVYASPDALDVLRGGATLDEASRKAGGEQMELIALLQEASYRLTSANAVAPYHRGNAEALRLAHRCVEGANGVLRSLAAAPDGD